MHRGHGRHMTKKSEEQIEYLIYIGALSWNVKMFLLFKKKNRKTTTSSEEDEMSSQPTELLQISLQKDISMFLLF